MHLIFVRKKRIALARQGRDKLSAISRMGGRPRTGWSETFFCEKTYLVRLNTIIQAKSKPNWWPYVYNFCDNVLRFNKFASTVSFDREPENDIPPSKCKIRYVPQKSRKGCEKTNVGRCKIWKQNLEQIMFSLSEHIPVRIHPSWKQLFIRLPINWWWRLRHHNYL